MQNTEQKLGVENGYVSLMPDWSNYRTWHWAIMQMISGHQVETKKTLAYCRKAVPGVDMKAFFYVMEANAKKEMEFWTSVYELARYEHVLMEEDNE